MQSAEERLEDAHDDYKNAVAKKRRMNNGQEKRRMIERTRVLTEKYHEAMLECKKACAAYEDLEAQTEDLTLVPYDERDISKSSSQSVD